MINVVVPISNNAQEFYEVLGRLGNISNANVLVGVCESQYEDLSLRLRNFDNVSIYMYADGTHREEMINALQYYLQQGSVMIMRKPISMEEFNRFIVQKKDVVTCVRGMGKVKTYLLSLWQKILKLILGVQLYEGDTSVIYFNEDISSVLSQSSNLSYSSRADRWKGIEQATIETKAKPVKTPVNKKRNLYYIICCIIALAVSVTITTTVCLFAKMSIIIGLLLACLDIIALAIVLVMCVVIAFNQVIGKKHFDRATEKNKIVE